jgi:hypothetical protein
MAIAKITAPLVDAKLEDHITKHRDVYDPRSEKMHKTLYGETGVNGLAGMLKAQGNCIDNITEKLDKIDSGINKVLWTVGLAVLAAVLKLVIIG